LHLWHNGRSTVARFMDVLNRSDSIGFKQGLAALPYRDFRIHNRQLLRIIPDNFCWGCVPGAL
jgi:hypothetical protein